MSLTRPHRKASVRIVPGGVGCRWPQFILAARGRYLFRFREFAMRKLLHKTAKPGFLRSPRTDLRDGEERFCASPVQNVDATVGVRRSSLSSALLLPSRVRTATTSVARWTRSDWTDAAQEIETVIFGDSDDEEENDNGGVLRKRGRRRASAHLTGLMIRSGNNFGMRLIKRTRRSSTRSAVADPPTVPVTHIPCNLFDDQQMIRSTTATLSGTPSRNVPPSPVVIYGKKYRRSPESLFRPVSIVLASTFVASLVVRIATNLLTTGLGMVVVVFFLAVWFPGGILLLCRPVRLVRALHSSPVLFGACSGAILGALHALWHDRVDRFLLGSSPAPTTARNPTGLSSYQWLQIGDTTNALAENDGNGGGGGDDDYDYDDDESTYNDLIMLLGLFRGLFYGVQLGSVWLVVFGDGSKPSALTQTMHRRIWGPLQHYHGRLTVKFHSMRRYLVPSSSNSLACTIADDMIPPEQGNGHHRHRCTICLDVFDLVQGNRKPWRYINNGNTDTDARSSHHRCQLLPCMHCFHDDCARHWLKIRHTCPICRVPVLETQPCD